MTLGPAIIALALFNRYRAPFTRPFVILGRVPLFYYLLHIPLIHAAAMVFAFIRYGPALLNHLSSNQPPPDYGYNLLVVYLVWVAVVLALYPVCRWFANLKQRRRDVWLSYF